MSRISMIVCGAILLTVPTIEFGGYFLLKIISGYEKGLALTEFQEAMYRAGHAHAGTLVILSLVALILSDYAPLGPLLMWIVRLGFPFSAILISGGFFAAGTGDGLTEPNDLIIILYAGVILLTLSLFILGAALIRKKTYEHENIK